MTTNQRTLHMEHYAALALILDRDLTPDGRLLSLILATYLGGKGRATVSPHNRRLIGFTGWEYSRLYKAQADLHLHSRVWKREFKAREAGGNVWSANYALMQSHAGNLPRGLTASRAAYYLGHDRRSLLKAIVRYNRWLAYGNSLTTEQTLVLAGYALWSNHPLASWTPHPRLATAAQDAFGDSLNLGKYFESRDGYRTSITADLTEWVEDWTYVVTARLMRDQGAGRDAWLPEHPRLVILTHHWNNTPRESNLEHVITETLVSEQVGRSNRGRKRDGTKATYLYALYDPEDIPGIDAPRYVGITDRPAVRHSEHCSPRHGIEEGNKAYQAWKKDIAERPLREDGTPQEIQMRTLGTYPNSRAARKAEQELIIRLAQENPGRLLNLEYLITAEYSHLLHPLNELEYAELRPLREALREAEAHNSEAPASEAPVSEAPVSEARVIRAWCREHGIPVSARGRIPKAVIKRYRQAHRHSEAA